MKKSDWILLLVILVASVLALCLLYAFLGGTGNVAVVSVDGEELARLPLDEDTELLIEGYGGGTNLLVIEDGRAYIREASCPDLVCVHTGAADELKSVVCAPNRVTVSIEPR